MCQAAIVVGRRKAEATGGSAFRLVSHGDGGRLRGLPTQNSEEPKKCRVNSDLRVRFILHCRCES
jgi:hypothetical protein